MAARNVPAEHIAEIEAYLGESARGVAAKPSDLRHLFPEFPGCNRTTGFRARLKFPADAVFHRKQAEEPKNATVLREALYEVTGRKLVLEFTLGENGRDHERADDEPHSEHDLIALIKDEFDAREVTE